MVCGMCKKEIVSKVKVKKGCICQECYSRLPNAVKNSVKSFTIKQLSDISKVCHEHTEEPKLKIGNLHICFHSIHVNQWEINIKDIKNISLNFHPRQSINQGVCCGYITVVIEMMNPHVLIEEPFYDNEVLMRYNIFGYNISYVYNQNVSQVISDIQDAIKKNELTFGRAIQNSISQAKQNTYTNSNSESRQKQEKRSSSEPKNNSSPFTQAREMFGVEIPYTKDTLKKKRNELIRKWHPDLNKGNEAYARQMTELILKNYDLLMEHADK